MHPDSITHLVLIALSWAAYGAVHSLLAATATKRRFAVAFPAAAPGYRLLYNLLALVLLIPVAWLVLGWEGPMLWSWHGAAAWVANGLAVLAVGGFLWSMKHYSGQDFVGLRQWRERDGGVHEREALTISPLHRWVRHPWYFLGLVILWTRDMDAARLVSAACITLYLVIGSRLEDATLIERYGDAYRRYRERVPGLVPLPWRRLGAREAADIVAQARRV